MRRWVVFDAWTVRGVVPSSPGHPRPDPAEGETPSAAPQLRCTRAATLLFSLSQRTIPHHSHAHTIPTLNFIHTTDLCRSLYKIVTTSLSLSYSFLFYPFVSLLCPSFQKASVRCRTRKQQTALVSHPTTKVKHRPRSHGTLFSYPACLFSLLLLETQTSAVSL